MNDDLSKHLIWAAEQNVARFEAELTLDVDPPRRALLETLLKKELELVSELRLGHAVDFRRELTRDFRREVTRL